MVATRAPPGAARTSRVEQFISKMSLRCSWLRIPAAEGFERTHLLRNVAGEGNPSRARLVRQREKRIPRDAVVYLQETCSLRL